MGTINRSKPMHHAGVDDVKLKWQKIYITRQAINAIENHKYNLSLELALKLIKYFDVTIDEIFKLEEE